MRNWVTKIHRDSKGYLWFCTVEGISLFDGYRFTNFSTRDGLPSRLVSDMIETQRGDYWFATNAGLARFHKDHGKAPAFDAVRVGDSKESNDIQELYEGRDGTIWCGTNAGLYRFRPQDGEPGPRLTPLDAAAPPEVLALAEDSRQNLWVATPRALLRRRPSGEIDSLPIPSTIARIESMLVDGHDRLWAGGFGVAGIDTKTEPPRVLPPEDIPGKTPGRISSFYQGERGEIWIGGSTGLVRFRPDASPPDVLAYTPSDAFPIRPRTAPSKKMSGTISGWRLERWGRSESRGARLNCLPEPRVWNRTRCLVLRRASEALFTRLPGSGRSMNSRAHGSFRSRFECPGPGTHGRQARPLCKIVRAPGGRQAAPG